MFNYDVSINSLCWITIYMNNEFMDGPKLGKMLLESFFTFNVVQCSMTGTNGCKGLLHISSLQNWNFENSLYLINPLYSLTASWNRMNMSILWMVYMYSCSLKKSLVHIDYLLLYLLIFVFCRSKCVIPGIKPLKFIFISFRLLF